MDKTRDAAETRTEPRQPAITAARAASPNGSQTTPPPAGNQTQSPRFTDWASI